MQSACNQVALSRFVPHAHQRAQHVAGRAPFASPLRPPRARSCEIARDGREMRGDRRSAPRAPPCVDEARRAPRPSSPPAARQSPLAIRGNQSQSVAITCRAAVSPHMRQRGSQSAVAITCRSASHVSIAACRRHVRSPCTERRRRENAQTRASNISFHAAHPRRNPA